MSNDFLSSLFAKKVTVPNSPLMTEEEMEAQLRKEDPMAFEPAAEEPEQFEPTTPGPLATQQQIEKIQSFPKSQAEQRAANDKIVEEEILNSQVDDIVAENVEQPKNKYQEILEAYRSLKPKQEEYQGDLNRLAMLQGANQIAQGMARGYGADVGSGEAGIKALKDAAQEPLDAVKRQMSTGKEAMSIEDEIQMQDPDSDVSKFYRDQAYSVLKRLNPNTNLTGQLEGMSASQLQKLPGMKNIGASQPSPWIATDRVDEQGNPIRFNKITGEYSTADGNVLKSGDYSARDILRRDPLTGKYGIGNVGSGLKVLPTQYGSGVDLNKEKTGEKAEKPREVTYGEFAKTAPDLAKKFDGLRDKFNQDMKESREVATSVTNLSSKLKPGSNNEIDSGLLGGIQTQAAKMAGQKGVLTDQDLVKFAGAGGVPAKIERIIDGSIFGEMSDSDIKFFKRFSNLMGKSLNEDILNRSQLFVEQGRQIVDTVVPGVSSDNISKMLAVDKIAPVVQGNKEKSTSKDMLPGMVRMQSPDGRILDIPKENVEKAKKRGLIEVK